MFPVQIFGRQGAMVVASPFPQNYDPTLEGACEFSQWPLCAIFSKNIGAPVTDLVFDGFHVKSHLCQDPGLGTWGWFYDHFLVKGWLGDDFF